MSDLCLNEGTLQSYYDGQLAPEAFEQVDSHLASCPLCKDAARQIESEMELTSAAFAAEMALSVPSERLRNRLDEAIAGLNNPPVLGEGGVSSRVRTWFGSLGSIFNLSPQRTLGFASLVVFFVLAAVVGGVVMRQRDSQTGLEVAGNQNEMADLSFDLLTRQDTEPNGKVIEHRIARRRPASSAIRSSNPESANGNVVELAHRQLPGERNYLQAISLLTEAIEANGETSLKPTLLADYKRNLEVVNEAIKATQRTARTNPESPDAAEMLFEVYQSKLDLLSAVAEQSQPMIAKR